MAALTIKNIPDGLYTELERLAAQHNHGINGEVIRQLSRSLLAGNKFARLAAPLLASKGGCDHLVAAAADGIGAMPRERVAYWLGMAMDLRLLLIAPILWA